MRAIAVFPKERAVRLVDHPEPRLEAPTQVKVRMLEVGVCGTDREIVTFQYGAPPAGEPYLILGHESLGEVVEVGDQVEHFKPGDLAVLMVRRPCPHDYCRACRAGRQDFCYTGDYTERGIKERHGFMAEFVVDEAQYLFAAPSDLRPVAVLTEPLTIAEKSVIQLWEVQERLPWECRVELDEAGKPRGYCHKALVLGAGPVGLLGAMLLRHHGFDTHVYSREDRASAQAKICDQIGAHYLSSQETPLKDLQSHMGAIDVVYEATGASKLSFDVLAQLGTNGVFIFTGVPGRHEQVPVGTDQIMKQMVLNNQIVYGSVNAGPRAFQQAIQDLAEFRRHWPAALEALITQRHPMADFETPLLHPGPGIKHVIRIAD